MESLEEGRGPGTALGAQAPRGYEVLHVPCPWLALARRMGQLKPISITQQVPKASPGDGSR